MSTKASFILRLTIAAIIAASLVAFVLYLALFAPQGADKGCEIPGCGKQATPTTAIRTTTTTVGLGGEGPARPLALGPCPKTNPNWSLTKLNAGVAGLDKKLVPIDATTAWTCRWNSEGRLHDGGYMKYMDAVTTVVSFVKETNRIPTSWTKGAQTAPPVPTDIGFQPIYLTFAGRTQHVTLRLDAGGQVTNGVLSGNPTLRWLGDFEFT